MRLKPNTLQQRTFFSILLPTFLLLFGLSFAGFLLLRDILLDEWGVAAIARLGQTGQLIDTQIRKPKELLLLLQGNGKSSVSREMANNLLTRIEELDGVMAVNVRWPGMEPVYGAGAVREMMSGMGAEHHYRMRKFSITSPRYDAQLNNRTVSLVAEFNIKRGEVTGGSVEVVFAFDTLIKQVVGARWWHNYKAYLVDESSNVLISTGNEKSLDDDYPMRAFGTLTELENQTLQEMGKHPESGTVFGPGLPPVQVSGYYRLTEAPWTMVVIAPGNVVLKPIIRFRTYYVAAIGLCILFILIFIRITIGRMTQRVRAISAAADDLAHGRFGPPLVTPEQDEVGELARSFNRMTRQLQQRLAMKEAIDIAREVQQNLLPDSFVPMEGLQISGRSLYCDETGGDYFDILTCCEDRKRVGVVVGDVVGHGIGAALLMTTIRALVRCRAALPAKSPQELVTDVNRLLCRDTKASGSFVTLFYLEVDLGAGCLRWVRGGHEPAVVYTPSSRRFSELRGNGIALGVDADCAYESNQVECVGEPQIILLCSDGAWEVENSQGEQFGRERLRKVIAASAALSSDEILKQLIEEIDSFCHERPKDDDITLVVVKLGAECRG